MSTFKGNTMETQVYIVFLNPFFDWVKPSNWFLIVCFSMLWYYTIVSEKGRRFGAIKTFNPSANVCTCPKSGIWCTVVVVCLCNLYVFLVSRFLYRFDRWFSHLNGFKLVVLGHFIACCSVWAKAPCWRPYIDL